MPDTPPPTCPFCDRRETLKAVESLLTEIHICRDCYKTFTLEKLPRISARTIDRYAAELERD